MASYLQWLCKTPKTTIVRINTLKSNIGEMRQCIEDACTTGGRAKPTLTRFTQIPDVLLIENEDNVATACDNNKEIIVDTICGAAILRGAHIYAPGVLAMQTNTKLNEMVNVYADVDGACKKGTCTIYESKRKVFVGIGRVKMQRYQLFSSNSGAKGVAVEMLQTVSGVPSIGDTCIPTGKALLQNLPSIVCSLVLDPKTHEFILDMCAAPGNKTTHLAQLIQNQGRIIALDKSSNRVSSLRRNVDEFNAKCVECYVFDATKCLKLDGQCDGVAPPFNRNSFDRILLDAPCSGFGNRPQLANAMTTKMLNAYPIVQRKLLEVAVQLLKPDGVLVYSTCTIFPSENETMIKWILNRFDGEMKLVAAEPFHGRPGWPNCGLSDEERGLVQRFGHDVDPSLSDDIFNDTVAFFIAKFRKMKNNG